MSFEFIKSEIKDVILVKPKVLGDDRGFFMETYEKLEFAQHGIDVEFSQDNHSKSKAHVLRGLHYQKPPHEQAKLVRCLQGQIYDVAVDIRKESKTFGRCVIVELSEENKNMLYIPKGFAHGFVVMSKDAQIVYKVNGKYSPEHECGIIWNDKTLNIDWKIKFEPILSDKDKNWKGLCI
jgi:dTDP-4-dehydrorhamnose 3,5-epimerase